MGTFIENEHRYLKKILNILIFLHNMTCNSSMPRFSLSVKVVDKNFHYISDYPSTLKISVLAFISDFTTLKKIFIISVGSTLQYFIIDSKIN